MGQVNASASRLPWANTAVAAQTQAPDASSGQGSVSPSSQAASPASVMDQMVNNALSIVLQDPARAQSYIAAVSGADLVKTQNSVSPNVSPAVPAAGSVLAGGPTAAGTPAMSTQATAFVQMLGALDPAAIGQAQVAQLTDLWSQIPETERPPLRSQLTQGVIEPTLTKIQQAAGARAHPGTDAAAAGSTATQQQAQATVAGLNALSAIIAT